MIWHGSALRRPNHAAFSRRATYSIRPLPSLTRREAPAIEFPRYRSQAHSALPQPANALENRLLHDRAMVSAEAGQNGPTCQR